MTIYDIAKEAGVSASSVSRVVNKKPGVNTKARERVEKLLEKYNFSPSETARGLVNKASKLVGILVTDLRTMYYTDGAYYIQQELAALGFCCSFFNAGSGDEAKSDAIRVLEQRRVEGAVLIGSSFQTSAVENAIRCHLSNVPVVMLNGFLDLPNVHGVLCDERDGTRSCVELLAAKNRTRLAYVRDAITPSGLLKQKGFTDGMARLGQDAPWLYEASAAPGSGYDATRRILREHPDVQGILYSVDLIAAGGLRALADAGVRVPEQVAVIGINNSLYCEICTPRLTSLDTKLLDSGVAGARILIDCLEGRKTTQKMMLFSSIATRETT
ncbi:MAG: LacI family DNA-binding transcriptional regulator [Ruthenibacterium sp.]